MSPRLAASADGRGGPSGARLAVSIVTVLVIAVAMLLLVRARPKAGPYDPRSSRDDGARALVLLLESRGVQVTITRVAPDLDDDARVLVLADRLTSGQRNDLVSWIEAGGVAIVADPTSTLHGGPGVEGGAIEVAADEPLAAAIDRSVDDEINVAAETCTIAALQSLRGLFVPSGLLFPVAPAESQCFGDGKHAFVVGRLLGAGVVVGFGDNDILTNRYLRYGDNSGLATALLAPQRGAHVRILIGADAAKTAADIGTGDQRLVDLVRPGVWMGLVQLALAFVVFAFARGIRTGRPVDEPRPVPVAGSEFVAASGNLMQRARHEERAAWVVRGRLYRDLCQLVRRPANTSISELDDAVAARFDTPPGEVIAIFQAVVTDKQQLVALTGRMHHLRQRIARAQPITTPHYTGSSS
jgi:hypothetical protein